MSAQWERAGGVGQRDAWELGCLRTCRRRASIDEKGEEGHDRGERRGDMGPEKITRFERISDPRRRGTGQRKKGRKRGGSTKR